ncbi:M50 family metallopeptidase [Staphylococcus canis]|uniref:M50 family peptidase n=1 Tax=Staphylococcus canis TaxID=2724942 RepID=A0ABS0T8R0_9STAP|nr:M50 family metallopeptidase [Staphylococcus canis]MBI5975137.1 M50 family peptidase [Staphylococcus canis]
MIHDWFTSPLPISITLLCSITLLYILCHYYRDRFPFSILDIALNYIPVLTHEFGHVFFNRLSRGRTIDLVVVATPKKRRNTGQQGYAITQSKMQSSLVITTLGGYISPPLMLIIGILLQRYGLGALFIGLYLFIFLYFTLKTSRKGVPLLIILLLAWTITLGIQSENMSQYSLIYMFIYHLLLGTLLGEVLQSSYTIIKLTFSSLHPQWDGSSLSEITRLPTILFSTFWISINIVCLYYVVHLL